MASAPRPSSPVAQYGDPHGFRFTTDYFKRLLIERHAIRAALENPGGSVILTGVAATTERANQYSSVVGNDFHLDLIEAEAAVAKLSPQQRRYVYEWVDGLTNTEAAQFYGVKPKALFMRRSRALDTAVKTANEE